jgi:membrane fusion protein (multidrug efflux system)
MSTAFHHSLRSLEADGFRLSLASILLGTALTGGWICWSALARITVYEVSASARLEVDQSASAVQAPLAGRLVTTNLAIGRVVKAGDLLAELDSEPQRLEIEEQRARLATLDPQIEALRSQIAAEQKAQGDERQAAAAAEEQTRASVRRSQVPAALLAVEDERLKKLLAEGLIPVRDAQKGAADASQARADVEIQQLTLARLQKEAQTRERDRDVQIRQMESGIVSLQSQISTTQAAIARLQYDVEQRSIRAPVGGRIAEAPALRPGAFVNAGERLGAIVPQGGLRVVAQFVPAEAIGRVRPGQAARLRFEGFPWTQYGSLGATVTQVANEVRDGTLRVELAVTQPAAHSIPLQHGLPGTAEVEVEYISPLRLVLRQAGRIVRLPDSSAAGAGATL